MTLEKLLNFPAEELEKLTDEQIRKIAEENGWLKITRPELQQLVEKPNTKRKLVDMERNSKVDKAQRMLSKFGMDLDLGDLLS